MGTLASELGAHVAARGGQPRVYVDANVSSGAVRYMRGRLNWDVFFVMEHDDLRRAADEKHYQMARQLHRTLVTMDRDFLDERRFPVVASGGVIVLHAPDERGLCKVLARIGRAFFSQRRADSVSPLLGRKIDVHPDWRQPEDRPTNARRWSSR